MSEQAKHTPAPWRTQGWVPTWAYIPVHGARHNLVCSLYPNIELGCTREEVEANAHRIVTCINAMAGLTNEQVTTLRASHAELVAALEKIAAIEDKMFGGDWDEIEEAREIARSALAAAKELT